MRDDAQRIPATSDAVHGSESTHNLLSNVSRRARGAGAQGWELYAGIFRLEGSPRGQAACTTACAPVLTSRSAFRRLLQWYRAHLDRGSGGQKQSKIALPPCAQQLAVDILRRAQAVDSVPNPTARSASRSVETPRPGFLFGQKRAFFPRGRQGEPGLPGEPVPHSSRGWRAIARIAPRRFCRGLDKTHIRVGR